MLKRLLPFIAILAIASGVARAGVTMSSTVQSPTIDTVLSAGATSTAGISVNYVAGLSFINAATDPLPITKITTSEVGAGTIAAEFTPALNYVSGEWKMNQAPITYESQQYDQTIFLLADTLGGAETTITISSDNTTVPAGSLIDGVQNIDALVAYFNPPGLYFTIYCVHSRISTLQAQLDGLGMTYKTFSSVFTANGATSNYTYNASALDGTSVTTTSSVSITADDGVFEGIVSVGFSGSDSQFAVAAATDTVVAKFISNATQTENILEATTSTGTVLFSVASDGTTTIGSDTLIVNTSHTPASETEACATGTVVWDTSFIYVCVSANLWKKATLAAF